MKSILSLLILLLVITSTSYAQFSIDKFLAEKLSKPKPNEEVNMQELMKNAVDARLDKIAVKVVNAKMKDGRIIFKSIANANLKDAEAAKLNGILKKKLLAKLGKVSKENVVNSVKNNMWAKPDGTTYMLTYSGNMVMLVILKK